MGNKICDGPKGEPEIKYINKGNIVIINFRTEDDSLWKPISIHDENNLKKGILMFREATGLPNRKIKKAVSELDSTELELNSKICDLNLNYSSRIIFYD